jgi:hypothetical protein
MFNNNIKNVAFIGTVSALSGFREPLLTWKASEVPGSHPVDYPVPSFGADPDMAQT